MGQEQRKQVDGAEASTRATEPEVERERIASLASPSNENLEASPAA
jgi:hypothetical protein